MFVAVTDWAEHGRGASAPPCQLASLLSSLRLPALSPSFFSFLALARPWLAAAAVAQERGSEAESLPGLLPLQASPRYVPRHYQQQNQRQLQLGLRPAQRSASDAGHSGLGGVAGVAGSASGVGPGSGLLRGHTVSLGNLAQQALAAAAAAEGISTLRTTAPAGAGPGAGGSGVGGGSSSLPPLPLRSAISMPPGYAPPAQDHHRAAAEAPTSSSTSPSVHGLPPVPTGPLAHLAEEDGEEEDQQQQRLVQQVQAQGEQERRAREARALMRLSTFYGISASNHAAAVARPAGGGWGTGCCGDVRQAAMWSLADELVGAHAYPL